MDPETPQSPSLPQALKRLTEVFSTTRDPFPISPFSSLDYFLTPDEDQWTHLHTAAMRGYLLEVVVVLESLGQSLTLEHFLLKDKAEETPLHCAAEWGHIDQILAILKPTGQTLTSAHFLLKDRRGKTPLSYAAADGYLDQIFIPSLWAGRVGEMQMLWDLVPENEAKRQQVDYEKVIHDAIDQSLPPRRVDPLDYVGAASCASTLALTGVGLQKESQR